MHANSLKDNGMATLVLFKHWFRQNSSEISFKRLHRFVRLIYISYDQNLH